jgi:uncharacterized oxidoreductase
MQLAGKTILVTGGTDGIGKELIHQLRNKGALVITQGRNAARVAASQADGFEVIAADLSNQTGIETLVKAVEGRPIDILVNNAGAGSDHDFREAVPNLADNDACIFLNLNTPIHLIARFMPMLRTRTEAMIVNVTSGLAIAPRAGGPVYCATKAGLRSYTQALRRQLAGTGIHVLEALPPVVETKMTAGRSNRKMPSAECARQIIVAMERNANEANVGMVKALQILNSISPALARQVMIRF